MEEADVNEWPDSESNSETWSEPQGIEEKDALRQWKYLPGGERIGRIEMDMPDIGDLEGLVDEEGNSELCHEIAKEARLLQEQRLYTKQRADVLQQEKDLLLWHMASSSKVKNLKEAENSTVAAKAENLRRRLMVAQKQTDIENTKHEFLVRKAEGIEGDVRIVEEEFEFARQELEKAFEMRVDSQAETTAVRRKVERERRLRLKQRERFRTTCNAHRKWMRKVESVRGMEVQAQEALLDVRNFRADGYKRSALACVAADDRMMEMLENLPNPLDELRSH